MRVNAREGAGCDVAGLGTDTQSRSECSCGRKQLKAQAAERHTVHTRLDSASADGAGGASTLQRKGGPWTEAAGAAGELRTTMVTSGGDLRAARDGMSGSLEGPASLGMLKTVFTFWSESGSASSVTSAVTLSSNCVRSPRTWVKATRQWPIRARASRRPTRGRRSGAEVADVENPDPGLGGIASRMCDPGFEQTEAIEEVALYAATSVEADAFGVEVGINLLQITRTGYTKTGRAVEVTVPALAGFCASDRPSVDPHACRCPAPKSAGHRRSRPDYAAVWTQTLSKNKCRKFYPQVLLLLHDFAHSAKNSST